MLLTPLFSTGYIAVTKTDSFTNSSANIEYGLANEYPYDIGIENHSAVIYASGFETQDWSIRDFSHPEILDYGGHFIKDFSLSYLDNGVLEYQNLQGSHKPSTYNIVVPENDQIFLRWYRKYEPGFDFACQVKTNGVYASAPDASGGGVKPTGYDKFSLKLQIWPVNGGGGKPLIYTYHPEQPGGYGESLKQNIGAPAIIQPGNWYSFEIMLKANTPGQHNGEIKLWINGELKAHYTGMRFRDTDDLKINQLNITAYVGGLCTAPKNQKVWDDNLVLATEYIGPMETSKNLVIDNVDQGFSTNYSQYPWQEYVDVDGQHYGVSHHYHQEVGTGSNTAIWSFSVPEPGNYNAYVWWYEGSYRPSDVPYIINHSLITTGTISVEVTTTVKANQQINGGQWNLLGNFYFQDTGSISVIDNVSSGKDIVADAVRVVYFTNGNTSKPKFRS